MADDNITIFCLKVMSTVQVTKPNLPGFVHHADVKKIRFLAGPLPISVKNSIGKSTRSTDHKVQKVSVQNDPVLSHTKHAIQTSSLT
jgi:hypothetical protein